MRRLVLALSLLASAPAAADEPNGKWQMLRSQDPFDKSVTIGIFEMQARPSRFFAFGCQPSHLFKGNENIDYLQLRDTKLPDGTESTRVLYRIDDDPIVDEHWHVSPSLDSVVAPSWFHDYVEKHAKDGAMLYLKVPELGEVDSFPLTGFLEQIDAIDLQCPDATFRHPSHHG